LADIGVAGGGLYAKVEEVLGRSGLRLALNPGHLVGYGEWSNTPIQIGDKDALASGMPFQVDVIPVPQRKGQARNCEDTVVLPMRSFSRKSTSGIRGSGVAFRSDALSCATSSASR
jgi:hypothetical protein